MNRTVLKIALGFIGLLQPLSAGIGPLPEEFTITERFIAFTPTFDIAVGRNTLATAKKRVFSWTTTFDLEDSDKMPLAYAKAKFLAWGTMADVFDPLDRKIGWIEEVTWKIISWPEFRIFNEESRLAAVAKMNFWGTRFDIFEPENPDHVFASVSRPFIRCFRDKWTVKILDPRYFGAGSIDPRLLIMIAVYQTDRDNRERLRAEIENELRMEFEGNGFSGACIERNSLSALLAEIDALEVADAEGEIEADMEALAHIEWPAGGEVSSPLDLYWNTLESGLSVLKTQKLDDSQKKSLIRLLKEYRNI
ncbi:MAG: hypothetical protein JSS32_09455 [Verrucomicrobia bacterium]|nr:hypothetical protein [Verrucomicrobiota bacterium]